MEVINFNPHFMKGFDFLERDLKHNVIFCQNLNEFIKFCVSNTTYMVLHNGKVISVVGAIPVSPGVSYIWQTPCRDFTKHLKAFTRGLRLCTEKYFNDFDVHRLYTICENEEKFFKWMIKGVGFEFETYLEAFGPNKETCVQFKRVRK